jgi:hypothetical protein
MTNQTPSNEVLAERLQADHNDTVTYRKLIKDQLDRIEAQAKYTNGRVRSLEAWRTFLTGAFVALSMPAAAKLVTLLSAH